MRTLRDKSFGFQVAVCLFLCSASFMVKAQKQESVDKLLSSLSVGAIPEDLLASKTIALYQYSFTPKELEQIQQNFERTGVDAVLYLPSDLPMSNRDVQKAFTDYVTKREIKYLLFLKKINGGYEFTFTPFNKSKTIVNAGQPCWKMTGPSINEVGLDIYRTALNSQKRINMLISPAPEYDLKLRFIRGTRGEYFAVDLKVDRLAIVKSGDEQQDRELEDIIKLNYPLEYKFFEPGTEDTEIRQKGFLYILCSMRTRGQAALQLLEYDMSKVGNTLASVCYTDGQVQVKTIPSTEPIFKYYFKQLENGNIFLGTKWDADTDWRQALLNQIKGLKTELRIN